MTTGPDDFAVAVVRRWNDGERRLIRIVVRRGAEPGQENDVLVTASADEALNFLRGFL